MYHIIEYHTIDDTYNIIFSAKTIKECITYWTNTEIIWAYRKFYLSNTMEEL